MNNKKENKEENYIKDESIFIGNITSPSCEYINYKSTTMTSNAMYNTTLTSDKPMYVKNTEYDY